MLDSAVELYAKLYSQAHEMIRGSGLSKEAERVTHVIDPAIRKLYDSAKRDRLAEKMADELSKTKVADAYKKASGYILGAGIVGGGLGYMAGNRNPTPVLPNRRSDNSSYESK